MKQELYKLLITIFNPSYWLQNNNYNNCYDNWLREALRHPKFSNMDEFHITLNGRELWIANYPYAYGTSNGHRPSRRTILWLREAVDEYAKHGNKSKLKVVN